MTKIRIRLKAFDHQLLDKSASDEEAVAPFFTAVEITNPFWFLLQIKGIIFAVSHGDEQVHSLMARYIPSLELPRTIRLFEQSSMCFELLQQSCAVLELRPIEYHSAQIREPKLGMSATAVIPPCLGTFARRTSEIIRIIMAEAVGARARRMAGG